jgi:hypothetical protein
MGFLYGFAHGRKNQVTAGRIGVSYQRVLGPPGADTPDR